MGVASLLIALSTSADFSASSARSFPVQAAQRRGSSFPSASAWSCSRTARASPAIGTSTARLWPSCAGSMSTWITFRSAANRGGRPNCTIQLKRVPTATTTSASAKALLRALRKASAWSSGISPREIGVV